MKTLAITLLAAISLSLPAIAQDDIHTQWFADFDKAVAAAKAAKKDLLVDFTGSDWCHWCKQLDKEVFAHSEFLKPASEKYILVALDFPNGEAAKARVPNADRNQELSKKHGIRGFPTVLLMTPDGDVFGQTGYQKGGPEKYIEHLEETAAKGRKALSDAAKFSQDYAAAADEPAKIVVIEGALAALKGLDPTGPGVSAIAKVARHAYTLDPKNEKGLTEKAVSALLELGLGDEADRNLAKMVDPKNEKGLFEKAVVAVVMGVSSEADLAAASAEGEALLAMGPMKDKQAEQMVTASLAHWNFKYLNQPEKAKAFATRLKAIAGDDPRFGNLIKAILGDEAKGDDGDNADK